MIDLIRDAIVPCTLALTFTGLALVHKMIDHYA